MAMQARHNTSNHSGRYDGATMGELVTERFERLMSNVENAQDCLDFWEEQGKTVPAYVMDCYQSAIDSMQAYADYWGFEC